jgi:hypothetical protein
LKRSPIRTGLYGYFSSKQEVDQYLAMTRGSRKGSVKVESVKEWKVYKVSEIS